MNVSQRKTIEEIKTKLETLKSQAEEIGGELQQMADDEREKFYNMPEGLQSGEKGQAIETAADALGEAASALENGEIGEAITQLEDIE